MRFREMVIEPGKKKAYLPVTETSGGQRLGFPFMVVNEKHEGLILLGLFIRRLRRWDGFLSEGPPEKEGKDE